MYCSFSVPSFLSSCSPLFLILPSYSLFFPCPPSCSPLFTLYPPSVPPLTPMSPPGPLYSPSTPLYSLLFPPLSPLSSPLPPDPQISWFPYLFRSVFNHISQYFIYCVRLTQESIILRAVDRRGWKVVGTLWTKCNELVQDLHFLR